LTYLDWVSHDVASAGDADQIRKEITRAAARLIEIPLHWSPIPIRRGNQIPRLSLTAKMPSSVWL
jgi:hypothetical protein